MQTQGDLLVLRATVSDARFGELDNAKFTRNPLTFSRSIIAKVQIEEVVNLNFSRLMTVNCASRREVWECPFDGNESNEGILLRYDGKRQITELAKSLDRDVV